MKSGAEVKTKIVSSFNLATAQRVLRKLQAWWKKTNSQLHIMLLWQRIAGYDEAIVSGVKYIVSVVLVPA